MAVKKREQKIGDKLVGKEIIRWNSEVQNGKGQGMKSKNEDANVLGGGRKGHDMQNPGRKGEQWKQSGGAERKKTRSESQE